MTNSVWSARRLLTMSSQSTSTFANQVVAFVIPWLVLSRTGSTLNAGGVAFADQPLTAAKALADVRQGSRFIVAEPLLNFARESAGALGLFLGVQALGGVLGGLAFAAVGPRVSSFWWFVVLAGLRLADQRHRPETAITLVAAANAVMVATFALVPAMRLVDAPAPARER